MTFTRLPLPVLPVIDAPELRPSRTVAACLLRAHRVVPHVVALGLMTGAAALATPALAQTAPADRPDIERRLERSKGELQEKASRATALEQDVTSLDEDRRRLNGDLVRTASEMQKLEARLTTIESRLGELEAQEKMLRGSLSQRHDQIAKLLGVLQRMGRDPPPVMITRREDALQMVRSAKLIAFAFPELRTQALGLAEKLDDLVRVMTDIRTEGEKLRADTARLADMRIQLSGLMETRKRSLEERRAELEQVRAAAAEISKNVSDLSELIGKLDRAVSERTALKSYEEEAKAEIAARTQASLESEAAASSPPPPPGTSELKPRIEDGATPAGSPAAAPPKETKVATITVPAKPAIVLAPEAGSGVQANPGRIKPAIPFHLAKAKLPLPSQGRRVVTYGERTQSGSNSKGIVIETRFNGQITSPCDGWVVYASEFRSYGQLLIINAGGGYHVLLAGMSQIDVQPGQFVLAAEPVGTMSGEPKTAQGKGQSGGPVLYVEFRKDGRPVDPEPWWAEAQQKVQG